MSSANPRLHAEDVQTALQRRVSGTDEPTAHLTLTAFEGPDSGLRIDVDAARSSRLLIGQSPACDVRLRDAMVSRRHAALDRDAQGVTITDLRSTNGTFVNGVRVQQAYLEDGQSVRLGSTSLRVSREAAAAQTELSPVTAFGALLGASPVMRRLYPLCARLAGSNIPVLIEGETGTGKEVLAEALHDNGPRAGGPFVVYDCTAIPASLMESELFGSERGAFTGALGRRGLLERAHGGTLLIDEIGDLDVSVQSKLLRAIERRELRRLGGESAIQVDVRILAATRRDLDREVQLGRFRDDLFHRLVVARIELPPLRERRDDIPLLARRLCELLGGQASALPSELLRRWEDYAWPGNVRELRNRIARWLALGELADDTSPAARALTGSPDADERAPANAAAADLIQDVLTLNLPLPRARQRVVDEFERRYIEHVLAQHGGNVMRAAAASGIARRYFQILRNKKAR
ncbi:MAG TPA: sigma 54-interacting transcriptional regulator [Polyangiaceae bacterium]|jgi:DNA-binding NtrC family response regulator